MPNEDSGDQHGAKPDGEAKFTPIATQDDLNRVIGDRVRRVEARYADYDDLKQKAARLDDLEQAKAAELQQLADERDQHLKRGDTAELQVARLEVALSKGLTPTQAKRLVGGTREELEADADELIADLGHRQSPKPNPAQGRGEETTGSGDWLRDSFART